jgi:hypothetical protein
LLLLGIVVGLWYLSIAAMVLHHPRGGHGAVSALPGIVIGTTGVVTIVGCITAFVRRRTERSALGGDAQMNANNPGVASTDT